MSEYRINVRLNLENGEQRQAAEFLQHLDKKVFRSQNAFVVTAILAYITSLHDEGGNQKLLDGIRQLLREEIPYLPAVPEAEPPKPVLFTEMTEAQKTESERAALEFLENF